MTVEEGGGDMAASLSRVGVRRLAYRPSRPAVSAAFVLHGAVMGSFAGRIPALQERLALSPGSLGLALLMVSLGCVTTMQLGALLAQRVGQRLVLVAAFLTLTAALTVAGLAPGLVTLCLALYVAGVGGGNADVGMNALGVHVERRVGRSVMSGLHGLWSVGGVLGAAVAAVFAHQGIGVAPQFATMVVLASLVCVLCWGGWDDPSAPPSEESPGLAWPSRQVLVIGTIAFAAVVAEIACSDWSAVYLRDVLTAPEAVAAFGVLALSASMAVGRLTGDQVVRRFGAVRTVRVGASGALVAVAVLVVVASSVGVGVAAFALVGLGISTTVPLAFAAAGRIGGDHPGQQIAAVATIGYGAGMATPSIIGGITQLSSIQVAFSLVGVLLVGVVMLAPALAPRAGSDGHEV